MLKGFAVFILIALFMAETSAFAEVYRRDVSFEWEEMPDAKSYDVEIIGLQKDDSQKESAPKSMTFKTKDAVWTGKLLPGKYTMSLRARDQRGVPGEWSRPSEFIVNLDPVKLRSPKPNAKIAATNASETRQKFEWQPVNGATEYLFELVSADGKTKINQTVKETSYEATIPVAQNYKWRVTGVGHNDMQSEAIDSIAMSIQGPKLLPPKLTPPENEFVREIRWQKTENAESYDLTLYRQNPTTRKWEKVLVQENVHDDQFTFDDKFSGGNYTLSVKAKGPLRDNSPPAKLSFKVVHGDRSPAAEYTALVRKSIDRVSGWYAIASYLITQINYTGETPETGGRTTTTALGGTGRLGAGYFTKDDRWGFLTIADFSGFTISNSTRTYSSLEVSAILRTVMGRRGEARWIGGAYYQELPQLIGVPSLTNTTAPQVTFVQSAVAGPHLGAEYWHSFTPNIGFQVNSHLYYSLMTMKSPNGNNVEPRISYQVGLMGSYRFNGHFTGLVGLTHRTDQVAYKANKTGSTFESSGQYDESQVTGDYLSFFAEYGF